MVYALVTGEQTNQTYEFATQNKKSLRTKESNRNLTDFLSTIKLAITELPFASFSKWVFVQNLSYENEFDLRGNEPVAFSYEWFRNKTPFDTEARGNSEIIYYTFNEKDARRTTIQGTLL